MAIVEIVGGEGSVPIRIEMPGVSVTDEKDAYDRPMRGPVNQAAKVVVKTAEQIYAEAIAMACGAAVQVAEQLGKMGEKDQPDEFEVKFGLSLGMGADTKIVSFDGDAQVHVRMQWNRRPGA